MAGDFEVLSHTADVGIIAYGEDIAAAFASAARGMFSLIADLESIRKTEFRDIELVSTDRKSLLVDWLNELVYLFDVENMLFSRFEISRLTETHIRARCRGEKADPARHGIKLGIKAATYHMLEITEDGGVRIQVLFDI